MYLQWHSQRPPFNNVEVPEGIRKKQNKRQTDKRNKRFKSDTDAKDIANDDAEVVSSSVNKTKLNTKRIFDKQGREKASRRTGDW